VQVRRGYARNHLVPRHKAAYATGQNRQQRGLRNQHRPDIHAADTATADSSLTSSLPPCVCLSAAIPPPQRLPFAMRAAVAQQQSSDPTSPSSLLSASPASVLALLATPSYQRRYLKELITVVSHLRLTFNRHAPDGASAFNGRPVTKLAIYQALQRRHCYFIEYADIDMQETDSLLHIGERAVGVELRVGELRERTELRVVVQRLAEVDEMAKIRKAEDELQEQQANADSPGRGDDDDDERQSVKGEQRAGISHRKGR
jgi:ribosomal protein L9